MHQMQIQFVPSATSTYHNSSSSPGDNEVQGKDFNTILEKVSESKNNENKKMIEKSRINNIKKTKTKAEKQNEKNGLPVEKKRRIEKESGKNGKKLTALTEKKRFIGKKGKINNHNTVRNEKSKTFPESTELKTEKPAVTENRISELDGKKAEKKHSNLVKEKNKISRENIPEEILFQNVEVKSAENEKGVSGKKKEKEKEKEKKDHIRLVSKNKIKKTADFKIIDLRSKGSGREKTDKNNEFSLKTELPRNTLQNNSSGESVKIVNAGIAAESNTASQFRYMPSFQDKVLLLKDLKEKMNDRIVKESGIILKDGNAGEIKLILKPESLGKVRIRLNLDDNNLSGKIFVETSEVKEVFEQNLFNLEKAFSEKGFSMTSLDVFVGNKGKGDSREKEKNVSGNVLQVIEDSIPGIEDNIYSDNVIDLVI